MMAYQDVVVSCGLSVCYASGLNFDSQ